MERRGHGKSLEHIHEARLLKKVAADACASNEAVAAEPQLNELAEAGGVVVAGGLGVAKRLHDGIRVEDLRFKLAHTIPASDCSEVGHDIPEQRVT